MNQKPSQLRSTLSRSHAVTSRSCGLASPLGSSAISAIKLLRNPSKSTPLIPAEAGIRFFATTQQPPLLDPRFRGDERGGVATPLRFHSAHSRGSGNSALCDKLRGCFWIPAFASLSRG